jgi:hypothetical protein
MNFSFGGDAGSGSFSFGGSSDSTSGGGFSFGGDSKETEKKTSETFNFGSSTESVGETKQSKKTHSLEDKNEPKQSKKIPLKETTFSIETNSSTPSFGFVSETTEKKESTFSFGGGDTSSEKKETSSFGFSSGSSSGGVETKSKKESTFSFGGGDVGTSGSEPTPETKKEVKGILSTPVEMLNLKNKTVEEIINKWNVELEEDVNAFTKLAIQASKWDKELLINEEKV